MNKLMLSKHLYNSATVMKTVSVFSNLADISVSENEFYHICCFDNSRYETEQTMAEFENYLIDLCNHADY